MPFYDIHEAYASKNRSKLYFAVLLLSLKISARNKSKSLVESTVFIPLTNISLNTLHIFSFAAQIRAIEYTVSKPEKWKTVLDSYINKFQTWEKRKFIFSFIYLAAKLRNSVFVQATQNIIKDL